ncbi:MAG: hypothetical protein IKE74_04610 [Mogibacterium sp.]|nr:hypothetical protein [Mogibacterium sp.]
MKRHKLKKRRKSSQQPQPKNR